MRQRLASQYRQRLPEQGQVRRCGRTHPLAPLARPDRTGTPPDPAHPGGRQSEGQQRTAAARSAAKLTKALITLETYVSGLADLIIDYASAQLDDEPFFTSPTEGAVQWLLHRRMGAQQQMRWSPRGAHFMLQVRTAIVNGTFDDDHRDICRHRRSFRMAA